MMFGPLYDLADRESRLVAVREAQRLVRRGGWVFVAAIPRFIAHASLSLGEEAAHPCPRIGSRCWSTAHRQPEDGSLGRIFTGAERQSQLEEAGLAGVTVCAIEGRNGLALEELPRLTTPRSRQQS